MFRLGLVLGARYKVYGIKSVVAIPLREGLAKSTIQAISSRNNALAHSSPFPSIATSQDVDRKEGSETVKNSFAPSSHVQLSSNLQVKLITPINGNFEVTRSASPQSISSTASTSSEQSATSPVLKAVATRLSFWNRSSRPDSTASRTHETAASGLVPQSNTLNKVVQEAREKPAEVISTILATLAPQPTTTEQRHADLEEKIIRECVREFTKGDMYFSYTFGALFDYFAFSLFVYR